MPIYLRQVCLVADMLPPVVQTLSKTFSLPVCHIDPEVAKFGLENSLLAIGSQFIEVVAPVRENTAAGRFLERRGGNGGYMVICQVPSREEQDAVRRLAGENGVRIAYESDRTSWRIMQLHPGDLGAAFLEVDWDHEADATGNWEPAGGKRWQQAASRDVVLGIAALELQSDAPQPLAERWAAVTGSALAYPEGVPTIELANASLRFVAARDGRGDGLGAIDVRVADRPRLLAQARECGCRLSDDQLLIGGVRFNLLP